jgi:hypothetical protein
MLVLLLTWLWVLLQVLLLEVCNRLFVPVLIHQGICQPPIFELPYCCGPSLTVGHLGIQVSKLLQELRKHDACVWISTLDFNPHHWKTRRKGSSA